MNAEKMKALLTEIMVDATAWGATYGPRIVRGQWDEIQQDYIDVRINDAMDKAKEASND